MSSSLIFCCFAALPCRNTKMHRKFLCRQLILDQQAIYPLWFSMWFQFFSNFSYSSEFCHKTLIKFWTTSSQYHIISVGYSFVKK
uniref:Uncharacterized protein n=1 Tax=Setaria italica TaxID=4555 RepID=K3YNP7_SETIT